VLLVEMVETSLELLELLEEQILEMVVVAVAVEITLAVLVVLVSSYLDILPLTQLQSERD
jgi:hypothetical protein